MKTLFSTYRILATVVGISIATLFFVGVPLKYGHVLSPGLWPVGSSPQRLGAGINKGLGIAHGFIYMGFVLVAFTLSRRARWSLPFTLITLLFGTVPVLSFWAEHRAVAKTLQEHPDLI